MSYATRVNIWILAIIYFLPDEVKSYPNTVWRVNRNPDRGSSNEGTGDDKVYMHTLDNPEFGTYILYSSKLEGDSKYCQGATRDEDMKSQQLSYVEMFYRTESSDQYFIDSFCALQPIKDGYHLHSIKLLCTLRDPKGHAIDLNPDSEKCMRLRYFIPQTTERVMEPCESAKGMKLLDKCLKDNGMSKIKRLGVRANWVVDQWGKSTTMRKATDTQ